MRQSRNILQSRKWRMIFAWAAIITACFSVMIAYAKYRAPHNSVKRVTVTGKSAITFFSSNFLSPFEANEPLVKNGVSVDEDFEGDTNFDIKICNTDVLKPVEFYAKTINYTLDVSIVKEDGTTPTTTELDTILGSEKIKLYRYDGGVQGTLLCELDSSSMTYNRSESLIPTAANPSATNQYRLVMPKETINSGIYVKITATPSTGVYPDLPTVIGGNFYVKRKSFNLTAGWTGAFNDDQTVGISQYDGFNYAITGGGTATKTLKWDSSILEVDWNQIQEVFSYSGSQPTPDSNNICSIPVNLSSASGGRYDIQFYVKDKTARTTINGSNYSWSDLEALVTLE